MKALDLYKFINNNNIEWHKESNEGTPDVIIFTNYADTQEFALLLCPPYGDEGIDCKLKHGYFTFWMKDICEYYGIELNEVFDKESWDE